MSGFDDKYKVHSLFEYLRFINCYGKANKEPHALTQWHIIGYRLFASKPIGKVFYLYATIFEIPM